VAARLPPLARYAACAALALQAMQVLTNRLGHSDLAFGVRMRAMMQKLISCLP
jgi:hypothetical protein